MHTYGNSWLDFIISNVALFSKPYMYIADEDCDMHIEIPQTWVIKSTWLINTHF